MLLGAAVACLPIFVIVFYCCKFKQWKDEDFDSKYGEIFSGLRKD